MNETHPRRLSTLVGRESVLGRGLQAAQQRGPSEAELRALERALAGALGAGALGAGAGMAAAKGGGVAAGVAHGALSTVAAKVTLAVVIAASGATGAVAWQRHTALREGATIATPIRAGRPAPRPPASLASGARPPAPAASLVVAASAGLDDQPRVPAASALPPPPAPAPAVAAEAAAAKIGPRARLRPVKSTAGGTVAAPSYEALPNRARPDDGCAGDELGLVERAQHALAEDPGRALALVDGFGRGCAHRLLEQEGEVIAVVALAKLGRTDQARARAEGFLRGFPGSAHAARVRRAAGLPATIP